MEINNEKEIANLWFEVVKTQQILQDLVNDQSIDVKKAEDTAWRFLRDKFPLLPMERK